PILDGSYSPAAPLSAPGGTITWTNNGTTVHTVSDSSGMHLFDSSSISVGGTYTFAPPSAGVYAYQSNVGAAQSGSVKVPLTTASTSASSCAVVWAETAIPNGFVADVQYQAPGSSTWVNWQ